MLTTDDVIDLLTLAAAYDRRTVGAADVAAWTDAARRGRWTRDQALDAVKAHYATSTAWLMPGHVAELIRAERRQPPPIHEVVQPDPIGQARVAAVTAGAFPAIPAGDDPAARRSIQTSALDRTCPHCGAKPGQACTRRTLTGRTRARQVHPSRKEPAA